MHVENGIYYLDPYWAAIERKTLNDCVDFLMAKGFTYWQVPSTVSEDTYRRQGISDVDGPVLGQRVGDTTLRLAGSAEQGILQMLCGQVIEEERRIVAHNTCFRLEGVYEGLKRVREFQKVEQYVCTSENKIKSVFDEILENAIIFMEDLGISKYRIVDRTDDDPGYHVHKLDIEVYTKRYGWLETHSCSSFELEQAKRYDITGECAYTLSNTGAATPRLLIPLMEEAGLLIP